jgi:hypothetical protein
MAKKIERVFPIFYDCRLNSLAFLIYYDCFKPGPFKECDFMAACRSSRPVLLVMNYLQFFNSVLYQLQDKRFDMFLASVSLLVVRMLQIRSLTWNVVIIIFSGCTVCISLFYYALFI